MKPVVIVGAGPAGLACARELVEAKREVVLIDDNPQAGGQYYRQLPPSYTATRENRLLRDENGFRALSIALEHPQIRHISSSVAWAAPDTLTIAYAGPNGSGRIEASSLVLATGAQDIPFPFPGWTLPGVMSAGGCLNLAKGQGLVPEGKVLVAGNGPLVLVASATLLAAGANVVSVVEAQSDRKLIPVGLNGLLTAPDIMLTALRYRLRIQFSRARMRKGWIVSEATGTDSVEKVAIAPIGDDGRPVAGQKRWLDVDCLVTGYGLMPSAELARMLGCRTEYIPDLNCVAPIRSSSLETTVPNVYAIGDGAGIGGAEIATLEGVRAARAILGEKPTVKVERRYKRLDVFRRKLNRAYSLPTTPDAATRETIICRCEELMLSDICQDDNVDRGSIDRLKTSSRIGMGRCQGRFCLPRLHHVLNIPVSDRSSYPRVRPPVRPSQLRYLAADSDAGEAREPDEIDALKRY